MIKYFIGILFLMLLFQSTCWGQKMYVKFKKEGKEYQLKNDFEIFFVIVDSTQKTIIKPIIIGNSFVLPDFRGYSEGHIVFKYEKLILDLGLELLNNFYQSFEWEVDLDKKPYEDEYSYEEFHSKDIEAAVQLIYRPLEHGDAGVVKFIPIRNVKKYLKDSKKLIE